MIKGRPILSEEIIFKLHSQELNRSITSEDIFREYCSPFKHIGEHFNSELRIDPKPSAIIDWIRGDLMYSDFGDGTHIRVLDYVKQKFNINYWETLEKIYYDFKLDEINGRDEEIPGSNSSSSNNIRSFEWISNNKLQHEKQPTIIRIKKRNWSAWDRLYWKGRYNISEETLEKFNVVPISHFWINDKRYVADDRAYSYEYYWENNIFKRKLYQPFSKKMKFISNGGLVVSGEGVLPYSGELLVISKAMKDVMCLYEMGITAISPASETSFLPTNYLIKQQKRFSRIVIFWDQDATGVKKSKEFSEKWNIPYILIPDKYNSKDISDFIQNYSMQEAKELMKELLWI